MDKEESGLVSQKALRWEQQPVTKRCAHELASLTHDCDFYFRCGIERRLIDDVHVVSEKAIKAAICKGKNIDEVIEIEAEGIIHTEDRGRLREFFNRKRLQVLYTNGIFTDKIEFRTAVRGQIKWYGIYLFLLDPEDSAELELVAVFRNNDTVSTQYAQLFNQATHDELTGLYNREATMQLIEEYLQGEGVQGTHALIMLDLDNLKQLNDVLGHPVGDEALRKVGICLKNTFRKSDICGRLGGDEFFVFIKDISVEKITRKAKDLLTDLQFTYSSSGEQLFTSASIGISMYHGGLTAGKTLQMLYAEADAALYKSKAIGKNHFTFFDEMDALTAAAAISPSAYLKNDLISYNLRSLFDNLANGIAIFHGTGRSNLKPVFCNGKLPELLSIAPEQFLAHMSPANQYAIHPKDRAFARRMLGEAIQTGGATQGVFRLLTGSGEYRYVTVFSNVYRIEDGSFDLYCIFSDAEEAEQLRRMQKSRHLQFQKKRSQASERNMAYALLNITRNLCIDRNYTHTPIHEISAAPTAESILSEIAQDIAMDDFREEFRSRFAPDIYVHDAKEGVFSKEMHMPFLREKRGIRWYQLNSELSHDPDTGDIEVFLSFTDIDNEVRLGYVVDRMLDSEYEYLCEIYVQSGYITRFGGVDEDNIAGEDIKYDELLREGVKRLLPAEYWESGIEALSLDRIMLELKSKDRYSTVFPVVSDDGKGERLCQWNCEYMDALCSTILMSRVNISRFLDYGYDTLTGMLARKGFYQTVEKRLGANPMRKYYLLDIDFYRFKLVNEKLGYSEGNRFLRRFAANIYHYFTQLDKNACIGRFEADHFVVFLPSDRDFSAEHIFDECNTQLAAYPEQFRLRPRMGVYEITDPTLDIALMYDCAHLANRSCKESFDTHISYYTADLRDKMLDEQFLAAEMPEALEKQQFEVWFQPQTDHADNGRIIGAEALVRWNHPQRGLISPAVFIPISEQNGFVYKLDKYVWKQACRCIRTWLDAGIRPCPISVNISRLDVLQGDFMETIVSIVEETNIPYELLHLEITESAFSENAGKVLKTVKGLIDRGFFVAIDDFGSGYSSLSMLKSVPAQELKLDMRFFEDDGDTLRNECIIESVVRMAKRLGMAVLAEGVESTAQADFLQSVGCRYIQGFLYAKPMPCRDFTEYAGWIPV